MLKEANITEKANEVTTIIEKERECVDDSNTTMTITIAMKKIRFSTGYTCLIKYSL